MSGRVGRALLAVLGTALLADPVLAHAAALSDSSASGSVPFWYVALTGGGVIGVSFLFASLVTDHATIREVNARSLALPAAALRRAGARLAGGIGVLGLATVVASGLLGPASATTNLGVLLVWVGWWAGYVMTVYLVGNSWPALNPWRTIARALPSLDRSYPERLGAWPSVVGLLGLVYLEVVTPISSEPRLLAGVVLAYTAVTLAGAAVFSPDTWFGKVDPIAGVFRWYGRVAPIQRSSGGLSLRLPGAALAEREEPAGDDDVAFVVALLWATTYDGLVSTPPWRLLAAPVVRAGVPPRLLYLLAILVGFGLFLGAYRLAARLARSTADSYVAGAFIERWFAPALLPIAAGYHVAHFLGYFLSLAPALLAALAGPLASGPVRVLVIPAWFQAFQLLFVVAGHVLAVWVSHSLAFEVFPGRLTPIRSQYPFIVVMVFYTMTSLWVVAQPYLQPPYV